MNPLSTLQAYGLSEKESAVYLVLLQTGKQTAYSAAVRGNLKKPTAYVILEGLAQRGIVRKRLNKRTTLYEAVDPVELFVHARERLEMAERGLSKLRALHRSSPTQVKATYFEGLNGIKEMYKQLIDRSKGKSYVAFYAHQKDTPKEVQAYWKELNAELQKAGIRRKAITTDDKSIQDYLTKNIAPDTFLGLKALPAKKYSSNISIEVYDSCTQIISHRYLQGILIENPDIADVMKQIFELVWETDPT